MVYRVVLADSASDDAYAIYAGVAAAAPLRVPHWFEDLLDRLDSLGHFPLRCQPADSVPLFLQGPEYLPDSV